MEPRQQFTFYRSYYDAIRRLPKKEQSSIILAVCAYALYGELPEDISPAAEAAFTLIRPTLDAGRRKAESGKQGGSKAKANGKQSESKPQANAKQTVSEGEKEKEGEGDIEVEIEKENECSISLPPNPRDAAFEAFWAAYPRKVGKAAAKKAFAKVPKAALPLIVPAVEQQKKSSQWAKDSGAFIPHPTTWINQGRWEDEPDGVTTVKPSSPGGDDAALLRKMLNGGKK